MFSWARSIILFVTCIIAFTWRTGAAGDYMPMLTGRTALALRIGVSAVLLLALVYLLLIINTFKKCGDTMDVRWKERVTRWASEGRSGTLTAGDSPLHSPSSSRSSVLLPETQPATLGSLPPVREESLFDQSQDEPDFPLIPSDPLTISPFVSHYNSSETTPASDLSPFPAVKLMDLSYESTSVCLVPSVLVQRGMMKRHWWQVATVRRSNSMVKIT